MSSKADANDKDNNGQQGANPPSSHADGGTAGSDRTSAASTADGGTPGMPSPSAPALRHGVPPEQLARDSAAAATMNASNDEGEAGDDAGRLATGIPSNGNSVRANSGQNLFSMPSNSNRNENDSAGGLLGENSPPLAPDAFVLAEVGLALPSMTQTGAPPPAAADIESGLDPIPDQNQTQPGLLLGHADGANEGGDTFAVTPRKGEEAPPTMDTKTIGDANSENGKEKGENFPASADGNFAEGGVDTVSGGSHDQNQKAVAVDIQRGDDIGLKAFDDKEDPPLSRVKKSELNILKSPVQQHSNTRIGDNVTRPGEGIERSGPAQPSTILADSFDTFLQFVYRQPSAILTDSLDQVETTSNRANESHQDITSSPQPARALSQTASNTSHLRHCSGPEFLHDDSGPPSDFPNDMGCILESTKISSTGGGNAAQGGRRPAGIEEIHSDTAEAPIPPGVAEELIADDSVPLSGKTGHSKKGKGKSVEIVDEDVCPPAPFPFEGDVVMKKKSRTEPEAEVAADLELGIETPSNNEQRAAGRPLTLDTDSLDDHVDPIDNIGSPHTTAEADVEAEAEDSSVLHIPHAFLVTQDNQDGTVYDAVHIPNPVPDEPLSWWKRHKNLIGAVSVISVATLIAVVVGSFIASSPRDNEAKSSGDSTSVGLTPQVLPNQSPASLPPTSYLPLPPPTANSISAEPTPQGLPSWSPTSLPPPNNNCTVEDFGPLYNESGDSLHVVGRDGTSLISIRPAIDSSESISEIQVLSDVNGSLQVSASHTLGAIGNGDTLAFSANLIFTSNIFDSDGGIVYVSHKHSSGSSNEIVTIRPAPGNVDPDGRFGRSIAVDGDVLVAGAPKDLDWAGSAFIFRQTYTGWSEEAKLEPPDLGWRYKFGNSVLVKGNVVVVGAENYGDDYEGAVFFYEFNTSSKSWEPLANNTLVNDDCDGQFGSNLGFTSDDGLLIGCRKENDGQGAVYYYQQSDSQGQYIFQQKITTEDGKPRDQLGVTSSHFAVSGDGNMFAAGTSDCTAADERVYVFAKFNNVWLEVTKIDKPEGSTYFGWSMAIAANWLLVTSEENTYSYKLTCHD